MKFNPIELLKKVRSQSSNLKDFKFEKKMDKEKRTEAANSIIRNHIIWSMGTGFIPVPIVDLFAVSAVQLDMIRQLSKVYELDFKETEGKAIITSLTSSSLARLGSRAALKLIPGLGSIVGGVAMSVLSGASSYALGEVFKEHFETGGTFLDFDPGRLKKYYQEKFEKGKKVARDIKEEEERKKQEGQTTTTGGFSKNSTSENKDSAQAFAEEILEESEAFSNDESQEVPVEKAKIANDSEDLATIIAKIKELAQLKEAGILTDEEFQQMKSKELAKY
ncbi:MAG: DUF697 domain-containing protein [Saprospiraceae bacterium]